MTDRIKELSKAAKDYARETLSHSMEPHIFLSSVFEQKFADLIIQDCITTLQKRYMGDNNREDMEVRRCVEDIKKHFGVE